MNFTSYEFLLVFLPLLLIGYYFLARVKNKRLCNMWLLISSIVFYFWFSVPMSLVLLFSILINFTLYRRILSIRKDSKRDAIGNIISYILVQVLHVSMITTLW